MTKKRSVSSGLPGPTRLSHQPSLFVLAGVGAGDVVRGVERVADEDGVAARRRSACRRSRRRACSRAAPRRWRAAAARRNASIAAGRRRRSSSARGQEKTRRRQSGTPGSCVLSLAEFIERPQAGTNRRFEGEYSDAPSAFGAARIAARLRGENRPAQRRGVAMAWFDGFEGGLHAAGEVELFARTGGDRSKAAAAAAARLSADARDVAPRRARARRRLRARHPRPARLRRFDQAAAGGDARARPRAAQQARDGRRHGRAHALARPRALRGGRPRPRRPRRAPARARSPGARRAARRDRHRADARHVRGDRHALRELVLPLVLPDPAGAAARADDRRRPVVLPALDARRLGLEGSRASSSPRRSPSTSAASAAPTRSTPPARTTAPRRRSTSSTTAPRAPPARRSPARRSCCGATRGVVGRLYEPLALWRAQCAATVEGEALAAGHFIPEELPDDTVTRLRTFLRR